MLTFLFTIIVDISFLFTINVDIFVQEQQQPQLLLSFLAEGQYNIKDIF